MGKYDQYPLKKVRARIEHQCNKCNSKIGKGEYYYTQRGRFLQFLHKSPKEFCLKCYQEHGEKLLMTEKKENVTDNTSRKLDNYL
jgi:hypothetical protein